MNIRITPVPRVPHQFERHLLPAEGRLICVRKHPAVMGPWVLLLIADLVLYLLADQAVIPRPGPTRLVLGVLIGVWCLALLIAIIRWLNTGYETTSHRIILITGFWWRRVTTYRGSDVLGVDLFRTPLGQVCGYGTLVLTLAVPGRRPRRVRVRFAPYPEQLYLEFIGSYLQYLKASDEDD
jgi:hypothetical protein